MKKLIVAAVFCLGLFVLVGRFLPSVLMSISFVPLAVGLLVIGWIVSRWVK